MTPPLHTPNRKGKVAYPKRDSSDMPRLGQNMLAGETLEWFKRELLQKLEEYESKATKED